MSTSRPSLEEPDARPPRPASLLLVGGDAETTARLRQLLREAPGGGYILEWAPTFAAGLRRARERVDAVLIDAPTLDDAVLADLRRLHEAAQKPLVLITSAPGEEPALRALRMGVQECLPWAALTPETLLRGIQSALARQPGEEEAELPLSTTSRAVGRILGFLGAKGGVGTTTVAVNIAATLANLRNRVVMAEMRGNCGSLASMLPGTGAAGGLSGLLRLPLAGIDETQAASRLTPAIDNLQVLYGPRTPEEGAPLEPAKAEAVVRALSRLAPYVVLDLPADFSEATLACASLCDFVGLVLSREPGAVRLAGLAREFLRRSRRPVGLVVVNSEATASSRGWEQLPAQLGCGLAAMLPPAAGLCVQAQEACLPLVLSHPEALLAQVFMETAVKLTGVGAPLAWRPAA